MAPARTFRIFVSSTFSDLKEERNALQKKVFPRLRELCMQHGCRFQAIDLRWGVREESALDQQTMKICYEEIARCQRVTLRPNFIVLLGDRYGWRPLPFEIPADEFMEIEQRVSDTDKELLRKWYRRDNNAVPPVYCLQPRKGEFTDYTKWEVVERRLHSILLQAIAEMKFTGDNCVKYTASATEQEIIQGLKAPDAGEHVFCFFRSIKEIPHNPGAKDFIDLDEMGNLDTDANKYLNDLKDRLRRLLPENIYEYEAEWTGSGTATEHVDRLCRDVYDSLSSIIQKEIAKLEESNPLDKEIADHIASGKDRAKFFTGRTGILKTISEYVKGTDAHPLAVSGASGSGKSALMAHAAEKVRNEHKNAQVVVRFIGATPNSSDVRTLLESLCRQISRCYGADESTVPADYKDLIKDLPKRLALATAAKPLFLFLDALDQLSSADNARNLIWLPAELPSHVRLVVSTLPGECLSALKKKLPGANLTELESMPLEEGAKLLDMWLDDAHRKLQEDQRAEILRKFELCGMPLYLRLAFGEAQRWKSYEGLPLGSKGHGLSEDIPGIIRDMFWRLSQESNHGHMLIERSLGYLATSRNGLTEDEMLDVLSQDDELYQDFLKRTYHKPPEQRLPVVIWSRLYFDLEPYLTERSADGTTLLAFYHRQLGEVVIGEYLAGKAKQNRHRGLAQYFAAQPLWIEREGKKIHHLRKVSEQPYQQTCGEMWTELEVTLTDLEFIEAKCSVGMTYNLVADYGAALAEGIPEEKRGTIEPFIRFVRARSHVLVQRPDLLIQEAYNYATSGPVPQQAEQILQDPMHPRRPWLRKINRLVDASSTCLQTLEGHKGWVDAVAVTPDGRKIVTGGEDWNIKVWDLATGACLQTLSHKVSVYAVATLDGRLVVIGMLVVIGSQDKTVKVSQDKTVKVWDLGTEACLQTLEGHENRVYAVAVTPDGRKIVTGGEDRNIKVWDLATGVCKQTLEGHKDMVGAIAVTPDGCKVVTGSRDKTVKVWDLETGTCLQTLEGHAGTIKAVAVTPDGYKVVTGSWWDKTVKVWDLTTGACLQTLEGHKDWVDAIAVTPDGRKVVTGSWDKTVKVWDLETGTCLQTLEGHAHTITAVAVTPDGHKVVTGSWDGIIKVWDLTTEACLQTLEGHVDCVKAVVTLDGYKVVTGSRDRTVKIWDLTTGACLQTLEGHKNWVYAVAVTPDGRKIVTGGEDRNIKVWDLATGACLQTLEGHADNVEAVAVTPDGRKVVTGSWDKTVKVWDLETGACLQTLEGHAGTIKAVAVTPDGRKVVTGSLDKTVKVWDLETGACLQTLEGHAGTIKAVAVTPDGHKVVTGSGDKTVKVWDMATGVCLRTLEGHTGIVWAVTVTPNCQQVVTGGGKLLIPRVPMPYELGEINVWDMATGARLRTLKGHKLSVSTVEVTPDGRKAATGSDDWTVRVWDLAMGNEIAYFLAEGIITTCAVSPDGTRIVAGDANGNIYFLALENVVPGPPVITTCHSPIDSIHAFPCPLCRTWSEIPASALGTEIPCPHCGKSIKLNPFTINADWRPVAKAWRGIR